jgi:F-type H+-transporting ATPase subunit delta
MNTTRQARREAAQLFRICLVNGLLDESRVLEVLRMMGEAKPRGFMNTLLQFQRLVKLHLARHTAKVQSAQPLSADLQASVQACLDRVYGPGLVTSFGGDPTLLGGMRIQVGSDVYDGSIEARLANLERSFSSGTNHFI